ncbi:hypothetical protein [Helicobacter sp. 11S03491-1]|uniref:hypothetical protein n=1 Tax=Helicobacter sp. 11S03491-1 TaxID=1476196 RepID=UPI000BA68E99|nr:hypothetical protein [Helicobacter sp. 11S03491-1]PAF42016.1 hypothetical protein BKH45_05395 [Helicobacter sp. 11S03491-1]
MRIVLISILLMGTSFVYGQSNNTVAAQNAVFYKNTHSSVLSDREQNIIFGSNVNVVLLDNDEMKHTQGFGFWSWVKQNSSWLIPVGVVSGAGLCAVTAGVGCLTFAF